MNNKERVKYFQEVIVSNHFLDEAADFIDDDCMMSVDDTMIPSGLSGMIAISSM